MRKLGIAAISLALMSGAVAGGAQTVYPRVFSAEDQSDYAPPVDVWLDVTEYSYGERIRAYFVTEPGAYVTILRVTTDGDLRVLYPRRPGLQQPYRIGQLANDRVPSLSDEAFNVRESRGTGFVFAIASYEPFDYRYYTTAGSWSAARLTGSVRNSDPFNVVRRFVDQTLNDRAEYSIDYAAYDVRSPSQRSRYAMRYGQYGYDDYYDLCVSAFGIRRTGYCSAYHGGYFGGGYYGPSSGPVVVVRRPPLIEPKGNHKGMRVRPVVPDPIVPASPVVEGRLPVTDAGERAAMARRERMMRDGRPRVEPLSQPVRAQPAPTPSSQPMIASPAPRSEPRRIERPPQAVTRTETRRIEKPQKDNQQKQ
jgi:hypothetical protein